MKQVFFLLLISYSAINNLVAQDLEAMFQTANTAYENKKFKEAIDAYEKIALTGNFSPELYYNLGNSYYRTNQVGQSILNYERALRLAPGDADIRQNLAIAEQKRIDDLGVIEPFFLKKWWEGLANFVASGIWSALGILLIWLGIAGFILWLIGKERTQRKKGFLMGIALFLLSLFFFGLANTRSGIEQDSRAGVIMKKTVDLRSAPDAESKKIMAIHEGLKIDLLDQLGEWYKVRLSDGEQGWVQQDSFEKI